jgi:nicotinate-nucleotide pyrophosphorylase (carboxylating)
MFDITHPDVRAVVERAIAEDIGAGDATTNLTVPADLQASGRFLAKQDFTLAGIELLPLIYDLQGGATV